MTASNTPDNPLEKLAARLADEQPVDWHAAGSEKSSSDPILAGLRELEQVMHGFRHAQISNGKDTPRSSRFKFGTLTVVEPLGEGSQGEVWRAYDPLLDLQVALKLRKIESGALSHQFLEEARHLARVRQANIVSVSACPVCRAASFVSRSSSASSESFAAAREGTPPLVATWGRTDLVHCRGAVLDEAPAKVWNPRPDIVQRLLADACEFCGSRPDHETHHALERQMLDLRFGEYVDAEPGHWLTWSGRGIYGRARYAWVTLLPLAFVSITTLTAGALSVRDNFYPMAIGADAAKHFQGYLNSTVTVLMMVCVLVILASAIMRWVGVLSGRLKLVPQ